MLKHFWAKQECSVTFWKFTAGTEFHIFLSDQEILDESGNITLYEFASGYPFQQMKLDKLKPLDHITNQLKFFFFTKDPIVKKKA